MGGVPIPLQYYLQLAVFPNHWYASSSVSATFASNSLHFLPSLFPGQQVKQSNRLFIKKALHITRRKFPKSGRPKPGYFLNCVFLGGSQRT